MKLAPPKVLIVDDEPHVGRFVEQLLQSINFPVVGQANSGGQALEKLKTLPVDLVILDITMPGISGDQLIADIKSMNSDILIVILSSRNTLELVKKCKEQGASGYILKNEKSENICRRIQEIWFSRLIMEDG